MTVTNLAGTITTGSSPRALWPGVQEWFGLEYDSLEKFYDKLYDVRGSERAYEISVEETGYGAVVHILTFPYSKSCCAFLSSSA